MWIQLSQILKEFTQETRDNQHLFSHVTSQKLEKHVWYHAWAFIQARAHVTPCIACKKARVNQSSFTGYLEIFLSYFFALSLNTFEQSLKLLLLIAELQRAKRASKAPWVRKIVNPSSRENLVMTSAYDRASERPYRLRGRGRGVLRYSSRSPIRETKECHLSLAVLCLEKSHFYLPCQQTIGVVDLTFQDRV